jgi:hypothetical protein
MEFIWKPLETSFIVSARPYSSSEIGDFSSNGDRPVTADMFSANFKGTGFLAQPQ